jgi:hypothetical protein
MKLRLEGTEREIDAVLFHLPSIVEMREVSRFYPNHGSATIAGNVANSIVNNT